MSRTALARKHRPRRFEELVGQDHVASTLRAAVEGDRVGHAYLFCGPRGVGKTTAARVLAMALNCPNREGGEPCGTCESCERIWSGRTSLDVVEIDAASNRGVDDARDLRERAMYAPSEDDRFKVYILDEAHMLTREAWNALLKILEEPPPRVIFAFATTEPQKIQQTAAPVLSRCQRFDFRRVAVPEIIGRMETVLEREGVEAEEGALLPVARQAEGGVRDALSLLDQVLSFSGDHVAAEDVRRMLGLVEEERYLEFFGLVRRGDRAGVFPFVQALVDDGYDPGEFVRGLADAIRLLLVLRTDPESEAVEVPDDARRRFAEMADRFEEVDLLRLLVAVSDVETSGRFRRSAQQRIQLEVLLLKLVSMESAVELEDLLRAAGGEVPERGRRGGPDGSPADGGSGEPAAADASGGSGSGRPSSRSRGSAGGSATSEAGAPGSGRPTSSPTPDGEAPEEAPGPSARAGSPGPEDRASGGPAPATSAGGAPAATARRTGTPPPDAEPAPDAETTTGADPAAERTEAKAPEVTLGGGASPLEVWRAAVAETRDLGGHAIALRGVRVEGYAEGTLRLRVPDGIADDLDSFLESRPRTEALRASLARRMGVDAEELTLQVGSQGPSGRMTARRAREQRLEELTSMDPTLREAVEELDLTLDD